MPRLILEHNENDVFIVQVFVRAGSVFEKDGERGVSHFLEHMMFKSKKNITVENLLVRLNALGGTFNAMTNKDYTTFYVRTIGKNWKRSLETLDTIVFEPHFLPDEVAKEKKVILEEYMQYEDDIKDKAFTIAYTEFLAKENPYRQCVKGTLEDIEATTPASLKTYYDSRYGDYMIYVNCGKDIERSVRKHVARVFRGLDRGNTNAKTQTKATKATNAKTNASLDRSLSRMLTNPDHPTVKVVCDPKRSQNATVIMFQGFPHDDKRNIVLSFVWNVLVGGLNSLLMLEMREKRGLAKHILHLIY